MPIKTERIALGIYCNTWQGHVTADEAVRAFNLETKLMEADGQTKRVSIIHGEEIRTFPMNVMKLSKIVSSDVVATIVHKVPRTARTVGEIIGSIAKTNVEFEDDWDKAVAKAQELLKEHSQV